MGNGFVSAVHTGTGIEQEIPLNWFEVYPGQWRLASDEPSVQETPADIPAPQPEVVLNADALSHLSPDVLAQIQAAEVPAPTPAPEGDAA